MTTLQMYCKSNHTKHQSEYWNLKIMVQKEQPPKEWAQRLCEAEGRKEKQQGKQLSRNK
jgi:7,8-dihydro-6-hydroxymethylpterin-pyrophosphokinase